MWRMSQVSSNSAKNYHEDISHGPIFIHSGFRTGGSAVYFQIRTNSDLLCWYDPLSLKLHNLKKALHFGTNDWKSNHEESLQYFKEYSLIGSKRRIPLYSRKLRFDYLGERYASQFLDYIDSLVDISSKLNRQAIFKFETSEGRAFLLKERFPTATNLLVRRNLILQEKSWLEQAALGNFSFYHSALQLLKNSGFKNFNSLKMPRYLKINLLSEIFLSYEHYRRSFLPNMDITIDFSSNVAVVENNAKLKRLDLLIEYLNLVAFKLQENHQSQNIDQDILNSYRRIVHNNSRVVNLPQNLKRIFPKL